MESAADITQLTTTSASSTLCLLYDEGHQLKLIRFMLSHRIMQERNPERMLETSNAKSEVAMSECRNVSEQDSYKFHDSLTIVVVFRPLVKKMLSLSCRSATHRTN